MLTPHYFFSSSYEDTEAQDPSIQLGVFQQDESLSELIERLSEPNTPIVDADYINLIVKYKIALLFRTEDEVFSEERAQVFYNRIAFSPVTGTSRELREQQLQERKDEIHLYGKIRYQLNMISDIPATASIMRDIIERTSTSCTQKFTGIDLCTGSGILMLAQYIYARRNGWRHNNIQITGIEINEYAYTAAQRLITSLRVGNILLGNTLQIIPTILKDTIGKRAISLVSDESLPTLGVPFDHIFRRNGVIDEIHEPFFENAQALDLHLWQQLAWAERFPEKVSYTRWNNLIANFENDIDTDWLNIQDGKDGYGWRKIIPSEPWPWYDGFSRIHETVPHGISLKKHLTPLPQVGAEWKQYIKKKGYPRRWAPLRKTQIQERHRAFQALKKEYFFP